MTYTPTQTADIALRDAQGNTFRRQTSLNPDGTHRMVNDVYVQDQFTRLVDLHLSRQIQAITLAAPIARDATTCSVNAAVAPTVGSILCLKEGQYFYQGYILSVTGAGPYTLAVDSPFDGDFTIAGGCSERSDNLNVDGSVTPVEFSVSPVGLDVTWDITQIIFVIRGSATPVMDDGKFGNLTALTKGLVIRVEDGYSQNLLNVKRNNDFAAHGGTLEYSPTAPAGSSGVRSVRKINGQQNSGVVVRLRPETGDMLKAIVQDNLTGLTEVSIVAQGHVVEGL